jgi:hypothetical protein
LIPPIENGAVAVLIGGRDGWVIEEVREGVPAAGGEDAKPPAAVDEGEII